MKIAAIRATPVDIPLAAPDLRSCGLLAGISKTIVDVESDGRAVTVACHLPVEKLMPASAGRSRSPTARPGPVGSVGQTFGFA
jgi:hypothetical protein